MLTNFYTRRRENWEDWLPC